MAFLNQVILAQSLLLQWKYYKSSLYVSEGAILGVIERPRLAYCVALDSLVIYVA